MEDDTGFVIGGVKFLRKDLPSVNLDRCLEIKAENNELIFVPGKYYKFQDREGKYHVLNCTDNDIAQPYSECTMKKQNEESDQMGKLWGCIGCEGVYGSKYYSNEEQKKILNAAGIKDGFFSVQVGEKRQELFLSNGVAGTVVPKRRYGINIGQGEKHPVFALLFLAKICYNIHRGGMHMYENRAGLGYQNFEEVRTGH
ncbi:MAG: hypothetical protein K2N95_09730, partial [Lachnospiraceae bacterium]|nr:hypothetical protein [Lachnospiraceae bacterium]